MMQLRAGAVPAVLDLSDLPARFETRTVLRVLRRGSAMRLEPRVLPAPLRKDYDALESPASWPRLFDTRHWVLIAAFEGGARVGCAIGARDTPGVDMLEGRSDLAVVWDLRVHSAARGRGIGRALFAAVEQWALAHDCTELKVETQDTNPAACAFYERQGCTLALAREGAYPELPHETQLIWRKRLQPHARSAMMVQS